MEPKRKPIRYPYSQGCIKIKWIFIVFYRESYFEKAGLLSIIQRKETLHKIKKTLFNEVNFKKSVDNFVGRAGFEPAKFTQQIYSLPSLAA